MTQEALTALMSAIAGAALSLAMGYIPGSKDWWAKLKPEEKSLTMLALLVATALAIFGLSCAHWFDLALTCDQQGVQTLLIALASALFGNDQAYRRLVKPFEPKATNPDLWMKPVE
jgi:hypothetical protein